MNELIVFSPDYQPLGIIPYVISTSYTERYQSLGEFLVQAELSEELARLAKPENVILFDLDNGIAGVISSIEEQVTEEQSVLTISGNLCGEYLYRRVIWGLYTKTGTTEQILRDLIQTQVISPTIPERAIPDIVLSDSSLNQEATTAFQVTGEVVGEVVESLCMSSGIGYKAEYLPLEGQIRITFYSGVDRTIGQSIVPPCIFATEFENLLTASYSFSNKEHKNVMLVAGEGEGQQRKTVVVGESSLSGKLRKEFYVDARDIQSVNEEGSQIPQEEYQKMLEQRGLERLSETKPSESFECTINPIGNLQYREDYFLGDLVTIKVQKLGITLSATITEVETSETYEGKETYVTFGYGSPTLAQKIKRMVR